MQNLEVLINKFRDEMKAVYKDKLERIVMHDNWPGENLNGEPAIVFMTVLKQETVSAFDEIKMLADKLWAITNDTGVAFQCVPISTQIYYFVKSPLLYRIRKQGKEIYDGKSRGKFAA
jgi:hypothetical protein